MAEIGIGLQAATQLPAVDLRQADLEGIAAVGTAIDAVVGAAAVELTNLFEVGEIRGRAAHDGHGEKHIALFLAPKGQERGQ